MPWPGTVRPVVAFGTTTRPSGSAFRKLATAARAADHRVRRDLLQAEAIVQEVAGSQRHRSVGCHMRGPATRLQVPDQLDRPGQRQERCRIARTLPIELLPERWAIRARVISAMARHEREHAGAAVGTHVEDACTLRTAQPLVAVAGPVGGTEGIDVDRDLARGMCGIDQRVDAQTRQLPHD